MELRLLGSSGLRVPVVSFGAGPVSQLLTGDDRRLVRETVARALELGVTWFDTAATYGEGRSEANLGAALGDLAARDRVQIATKVRLMPDDLSSIGRKVRDSVHESLRRLGVERVTLLQIHNSITAVAGAQPTSITPAHVLETGGVLAAMQDLQRAGQVEHLGLTALGEPAALGSVIETGAFATIQIPYNLLNPSAGQQVPSDFAETDHGNLITLCGQRGMGAFAIRVLAGGALAGHPPSPHTLKTPFFPLALYERDVRRAEKIAAHLPAEMRREEAALRFAISHPAVSSAIVGFASPDEVSEMVAFAAQGPLDADLLARLNSSAV